MTRKECVGGARRSEAKSAAYGGAA